MFGPKYIQGCMFAFVILTILSGVFDGVLLGQTDYGVMDTLTQWTPQGFSGWYIPAVLGGFVLALPQMIIWDYSFWHSLGFFGNLMQLILFFTVSVGFAWGFFTVLLPIIANFVVSAVRGIAGAISNIF